MLKQRYDWVTNSTLPIIDRIYWLSEDCKRYGTLPFAGIARAAFIAVQLFRSFVAVGVITQTEYDAFMNSLCTVAKKMQKDLALVKDGQRSMAEFLQEYGHLRPGAYDILSERYDSAPERYFDLANITSTVEETSFAFSEEKCAVMDAILCEHGLKANTQQMIDFVRNAIEGREFSKFVFTRSLSKIIMLIEQFGEEWGIAKDDLAHLDFRRIYEMYSRLDARSVKEIMEQDIADNKRTYYYAGIIQMPALIVQAENLYGYYLEADQPNYVTQKSIAGRVVVESELFESDLCGKVVFIPSADPGYDFLFTKNIGGLVTQYGGVNSHMAIRCAEIGIPAVIGAGESLFDQWKRYNVIEINCGEKNVRKVA
jgi:phosphohistidine swiveling domain-containing protein